MSNALKYLNSNGLTLGSVWQWANELVRALQPLADAASANATPVGAAVVWYNTTPPVGWLMADGASYATTAYPALFNAIGYTYGGAGANFNVRNMSALIGGVSWIVKY